jgi:tetratricopeptide (TPR) repeat protein
MKKTLSLGILIIFMGLLVACSAPEADDNEMTITTSSKEALELFLEGREKFELSELDASAELFDQAIAKDSNFTMAFYYRAITIGGFNVWQENIEKAMNLSDKVTEGERLFITFGKAWGEGDNVKAKENVTKLLELYPSDKRVLLDAGAFYANVDNDFEKAIQYYQKILEIDDKFAPAYNYMGGAYVSLDNLDAAEEAYTKYAELIPNRPDPYDALAWLLKDRGKYDESIEQYKKAYETDPLYIWALRGIGQNYTFKGEFEKAREFYQKMYDEAPNINAKFNSLVWKSVSYIHEGNTEEALKALDEYMALGKEDNNILGVIYPLRLKSIIHTDAGNLEEGMTFNEEAGKIAVEADLDDVIKENQILFTTLDKVYILTVKNDFEGAIAEAEKAKEVLATRDTEDWNQWLDGHLGYHYLLKGEYDKAIEHFAQSSPFNMWHTYYRAVAHDKKGEKEEAMKFYKKVANTNRDGLGLAFIRQKALEKVKE